MHPRHRPTPRWSRNHTTEAEAQRRHTELWLQLRDALAALPPGHPYRHDITAALAETAEAPDTARIEYWLLIARRETPCQ